MAKPTTAELQLAIRINLHLAGDGSHVHWAGRYWVWSGECDDYDVTLDEVVAFILGVNPLAFGAEARS